ncbi:MAG: hypothetical protein KGO96_10155 [Elusimicrobia bacterium]|nr:hypothetical protein [Elusimicrobiota bacterium]
MRRPTLIGMNNPISVRPEHALYPFPRGCAGNRLWQMLHAIEPEATASNYVRVFRRLNLVIGPWNLASARARADDLLPELADGAPVILLGREVAKAFNLPADLAPLVWVSVPVGEDEARFHYFPHPSGRNLWYNDPENYAAAGQRLADIYREYSYSATKAELFGDDA